MKICVIGKYPPIEGGVSAQTYWMCRGLAERGNDVAVVTNAAEVGEPYRIHFSDTDVRELNRTFPNGGSLRVSWTAPWDETEWHHVPAGNPTHARLISLALGVVSEQRPDVILSYYLEPYGVVASVVGELTGVPWVVRHAGSDRFRLMNNPELGPLYKSVIRRADGVLSTGSDLLGLGVDPSRVIPTASQSFLPQVFSSHTEPMDLENAFRELVGAAADRYAYPGPLDPEKPVVGMYGKVGVSKGTLDLLAAYSRSSFLRSRTQLVLLGGGFRMPRVKAAISEFGLDEHVWILPFVTHWRVPAFLRSCTVICLLERQFDIAQHGPGLLRETVACGVRVVASAELVAKKGPDLPLSELTPSVQVVPPRSSPHDLAEVVTRAVAGTGTHRNAPRAQDSSSMFRDASRDLDDLQEELSSRFGRSAESPPPELAFHHSDAEVAALVDWLGSLAPTLLSLLRVEILRRLRDDLSRASTSTPPAVVAVRSIEAVLSDSGTDATAEGCPLSPRDVAVLRLEADLVWAATYAGGAEQLDPFSYVAGTISTELLDSAVFAPFRSAFRQRWVRSGWIRFRRLPTSIEQYLRDRRNVVARLSESGPATRPVNGRAGADEVRLFLILRRPDLDALVFQVTEPIRRLLDLCDGTLSTDEIVAAMSASGTGTDPRSVPEWLRALREHGVVRDCWVHEQWADTAPYLTKASP